MKLAAAFLSCLILLSPVQAGINNPGSGSGSSGASSGAQLNLGGTDFIPANFINVFKTATLGFNTAADAGKIDNEGYLTSSPAGNVSITFPPAGTMWSGVTYKLRVDPNIVFQGLTFNFIAASCSASGGVSITAGCSGGTTTVASTSAGGSLTFTTAVNQFSMFYASGGTFSHTLGNSISLYRLSDETDFLAGEVFTHEFKTALKGLNPKTVRPMGWVDAGNANFNGETNWNYRNTLTTFTWQNRYPPAAWAGSISDAADAYTVTAPDANTVIGVIGTTNTGTTPTLNGTSILSNSGLAVTANQITVGIATFTFDSILNAYLYNSGGINASVPIEAQAQLANRINANLWATLPAWASDNYVTNWANTACSNLNSSLYLYPEYSNEVWNPGFPQTHWALLRGDALGFSVSGNQDVYGWYGLRVRQIMGNLIPVSGCSGHRLRRVMAYQGGGDSTNITNRFEGAQLCPVASGGSCAGNSAYNTLTGSASYNAAPNRPIDVTEVLAYAPYATGDNLCESPDFQCSPTAANAPFYQALVTAWETPNAAAAIALVDNDVRLGTTLSQTVTASGTTFTTSSAHSFTANSTDIMFTVSGGTAYSGIAINTIYRVTSTPLTTTFTIQPYVGGFPSGSNVNAGSAGSGTVTVGAVTQQSMAKVASNWYQFAESNAALFDASRGSLAPLRVEQYEGNLEPVGPSSAQCTTLGITGTNCTGSIAASILAWKADPKANATQTAYFNQFMGTDATIPPTFGLMPHSKTPSQLILPNVCGGGVLTGAGAYALLSDCLPNSTPFQLYNGFAAFSGVP